MRQADKDGNDGIDFSEFAKLWAAIKGEGEVNLVFRYKNSVVEIKYLKPIPFSA